MWPNHPQDITELCLPKVGQKFSSHRYFVTKCPLSWDKIFPQKVGQNFPGTICLLTDQLVPNRLHCDAHLLQGEDVEQRVERCVCVRLLTKLPGFPETPFFACELVLVILDQMSLSFFFLPSGSLWSSPPPCLCFLNLAWDSRTLGAERIGHLIRLGSISIDWEEKNEDPLLSFTLNMNTTPT